MKYCSDELEQRINHFKDVLGKSGVRLTHQRIEIFREVARTSEHPDAETVYKGVRERLPTVSLDTVYRTLWLFIDMGFITTLGTPRERIRFDANITHHHHFVCVKCGKVRDFISSEFNGLKPPREVQSLGTVKSSHIELNGTCTECLEQDIE
jgi:Fur family transcriptional regulator, peroxide stress response regulator